MFAIIITEKGGTERREVFDKTEINVGRVQGNELVLPKGNVSKHHARLLFRDGRFIVTDLKSTNGTYVNGRKITQATIVREGDKVYVGDFILRVEVPQQAQLPAPEAGPMAVPRPSAPPPAHGEITADRPVVPGREGVPSHYPLENDPDEMPGATGATAAAAAVRMPPPPRVPATTRELGSAPGQSPPVRAMGAIAIGPAVQPGTPATATADAVTTSPVLTPSAAGAAAEGRSSAPRRPPAPQRPSGHPPAPVRHVTPTAFTAPEPQRTSTQRMAAVTLIARIEEMLDLSSLDSGAPPDEPLASRLERAVREEMPKLKASGEIAPDVDLEAAVHEAREELVGLGPLDALLRDDDVLEVHVQSYASVSTTRASVGRKLETPFASDAACRRILRRLCWQIGAPVGEGEAVVERVLRDGTQLVALFDPYAVDGAIASLCRRGHAAHTIEDLVRNGVMSRAIATFLTQVVGARRNILIAGPPGSGVGVFVGALASASTLGERVLVVQEPGPPGPLVPNASTLMIGSSDRAREVMSAACRLRPDRLLAPSLGGEAAAQLLDAIAGGAEGVIAGVRAATLRLAVARLSAEAARFGTGIDPARELVAASFDVLIEYARLRDGRSRVLRVAEPAGVEGGSVELRDLFVFSFERTASGGAMEGSFHATGVIPTVAEDLSARGLSLEPALFRK